MDHVAKPDRDAATSRSTESSELAAEYSYVVSDLRRIGIIAVVMVTVLLGLALVLT